MTDSPVARVERLAAILAEENAALTAFDLGIAASLVPVKREATEHLLRDIAVSTGPQFMAALARVRELADENRRLLLRAMTAQRRVMELVAHAAARPPPASRYAANAMQETGRAAPLALLAQA